MTPQEPCAAEDSDLDALPLLGAFSEDEGLAAVCALHPQEAVCSVSNSRGQNLVTQHGVDHRALSVARPAEQRLHLV